MGGMALQLAGFIKGVRYQPTLIKDLPSYALTGFDINAAASSGIIAVGEGDILSYCKWKTPKRTRIYPFARVYNIYHLNTKQIAVIPIIKDEGAGTQNLDRINFITYSWMNLLNVYIILAWYDDASIRLHEPGRVKDQRLEADFVRARLVELQNYRASALHWNKMHFERDFEHVFHNAVESYRRIEIEKGARFHRIESNLHVLNTYMENGAFSIAAFKANSLPRSEQAARREIQTMHQHERVQAGAKGLFTISNYLGGEYHLTADEVFQEADHLIIQESKQGSGKLPALDDIKDGLFKLILFANLETLLLNGKPVDFKARLNLTGNLMGELRLPGDAGAIERFCAQNQFTLRQSRLVRALDTEARANSGLNIRFGRAHDSL